MREQFEQHGRGTRHARFVIGAVPEPAAVPFGFAGTADVGDDLRHDDVRQVARTIAVGTALETPLVLAGIEDAQRADGLVVEPHARIGMEGQRHVDRNPQSRAVGHPLRTPHQGIDPVGARHVVVLIIVGVLLRGVYLRVEPRPLEPVAGALAETGIAARLLGIFDAGTAQRIADRAGDIAVAAADLHGVGRDDTSRLPRAVGERHDRLLTRPEEEMPEVNPCPAAHRLVHGERTLAAEVMHRILRVVGASGHRFIAYIDGVFTPLGDGGTPRGAALGTPGNRPHTAGRTIPERVFAGAVYLPRMRESDTARLPFLGAVRLGVLPGGIVVGQHLVFLHIALAGQHHAGSRIFEHRHQVRQHIALGIEVFAGHPQPRTLPFPAVRRLVEIASVALPQRDMASGKPLRGSHGRGLADDERPLRTVDEGHDLLLAQQFPELGIGAVGHRDQPPHFALVGIKLDGGFTVLRRQDGTHRVVHGPQVLLAERVIGKPHRGVDAHPLARGVHALDPDKAARNLTGNDTRQCTADLAASHGVDPGGRGLLPAEAEQQKKRQEFSFHSSWQATTCRPW